MAPTRDYTEGMGLGKGYNILTGQPSIEYVDYKETGTPGDTTGQSSTLLYKQVTSTQELAIALDLNAELNINASWFTAKGSLKAKVLQSSANKINSYTTFGLIHIKVANIIDDIKKPSLSPEALKLIENETLEGFYRRAGYEYVSGLISGGELIITIEIISNDAETKKQVDAALNAAFSAADVIPTNSLEVSAEAKSSFSNLARTKNITIEVICKREGGSGPLPTTLEEALICAKNFPDSVKSAAKPLQAYCMSYELLPNFPGGIEQLVLQRQQRVLKSLWQQYTEALDVLSNVNYVLTHLEQFDKVEIQALKAGKRKLEERLDDITDRAQEYSHSSNNIKIAGSEFLLIEVELPLRKASPAVSLLTADTTLPSGSEFTFETVTLNSAGKVSNRQRCSNQQQRFTLVAGVDLEMVYVPAGSFMMGSPASDEEQPKDEIPEHQVTLPAFWMSKYPITQGQYRAIVGSNPAKFKGGDRPVESVSWHDAITFCKQLSTQLNQTFTLPSEAQWEYACRAGTHTKFYFGDTITPDFVNYTIFDRVRMGAAMGLAMVVPGAGLLLGHALVSSTGKETTPVGSFPPNALGLYDMHGNVSEWCLDNWHDNYAGAPIDGSAWQSQNENRLLRGGSYQHFPLGCCSMSRISQSPDIQSQRNGFRVCLVEC